jgi:hypothetical protein
MDAFYVAFDDLFAKSMNLASISDIFTRKCQLLGTDAITAFSLGLTGFDLCRLEALMRWPKL